MLISALLWYLFICFIHYDKKKLKKFLLNRANDMYDMEGLHNPSLPKFNRVRVQIYANKKYIQAKKLQTRRFGA